VCVCVLLVTCIRSAAPPSDGFCFVAVCMVFFFFFPPPLPPWRESLLAYSVLTTPFASSVPATCNTASKSLYDIIVPVVVVVVVVAVIVVAVVVVA